MPKAVTAPPASANVGAVAPSPQKMPQSCAANACFLRGGPTCDAHLFEKIRISLCGFSALVSTVMFHWSACSNTLWLLPYLVMSSFAFWHKCAWSEGSPPLAARGQGTEITGEHKGPAEVLPWPLLTLCGIGVGGFYKSPPSTFVFMDISPSLARAERLLPRITFSKCVW